MSRHWLGVLGIAALVAGCGGSTASTTGTGGTGGAGATGGSGGSGGVGATGGSGGSGGVGATGGSSGSGGVGGTGGTSGTCVSDGDCAPSGICGYPESAACAAKGQCFPAPGAVCNGYSPGCACDGSIINIICNGLPDGYSPQPLAHPGECTLADAGFDAGGGPFACGTFTCDSATQYCKVAEGGPCCNPPSYSCESIPAACAQDHSCNCIESAVGAQQCSESGGGVTVTFQYP